MSHVELSFVEDMEAMSQVALTHPPQPYGAYTYVCMFKFSWPQNKIP